MTVVNLRVLRERIARMQIKGHRQPLNLRPERSEAGEVIVEHLRAVAGLGEAIDESALEAELCNATGELACCLFGILHRQRSETLKPVRSFGDLGGQIV